MNTIEIYKVAPRNAFKWIGRGWELFKQQSGLWMLCVFFMFFMSMLASLLGWVGMLAYSLVNPFLVAGFYYLAFRADKGLESRFQDLFVAFADRAIRKVMIQLGVLLLLIGLSVAPLGLEIRQAVINSQPVPGRSLGIYFLVEVFASLLMTFAVPTVYFFHEQNILRVLKTSLLACIFNPIPLVLYVVGFVLLISSTVFTMFLALIIVLPWMMISSYLAFDDILRPPETIERGPGDDDSDYTMMV